MESKLIRNRPGKASLILTTQTKEPAMTIRPTSKRDKLILTRNRKLNRSRTALTQNCIDLVWPKPKMTQPDLN